MVTRHFLFLLLIALFTVDARAQIVYANSFEDARTTGWTTTVTDASYQRTITISRTPNAPRRFLGDFGSQTVRFDTVGLPLHDSVIVELDLLVIRSWDGNRTNSDGPDRFSITDGERGVLLSTTFTNKEDLRQAYPGSYPSGDFPAFAGSSEDRSLGYDENDATYRLRFAYAHSGRRLTLAFAADLRDLFPTLANESWGIDDVRITLVPPRPASATLVAGAAAGAPGERVFIPIHAREGVSLLTSGATAIRTRMRFNASMLMPETPTPMGHIEGNERVIDLELPLTISGDSMIARLNFRVAVGDDTITAITLERSQSVGGEITLSERAGVFRVTGLCADGGTRLIRSERALLLRAPRPNPAGAGTHVDYEVGTSDAVRFEIVDVHGGIVRRVAGDAGPGARTVALDTRSLPPGRYVVRLIAGREMREAVLVVAR